jgi:hypothetical protein
MEGRMIGKRLVFAALAAAVPASVTAQDPGKASDRALAPFVACRQVPDARARALCYDTALDKLQHSISGREVVIVDKQQANEDRKSLFGLNAALQMTEPKRDRRAREPEVSAIDSTVTAARRSGLAHWTIRLATGAIWRTLEPGIRSAPTNGDVVQIRRDPLGKFMMRVGRSRAMRAMRVN